MTNQPHPAKQPAHGGYERRDIGAAGVLYFLAFLAALGVLTHFLVNGLNSYLTKRNAADQPAVSPLANVPANTRHLSVDYRDYLKQNFPAPQLEIDERTQLNQIRTQEAGTLSTYDYIDQKAGTVRIPIERAMDLIVQRGLPVRGQESSAAPQKKETKQ